MRETATEITVGGQTVVVRGTFEDIDGICRPRRLTADDGLRKLTGIDGRPVTLNVGAVSLIREAFESRGAFGFARALEGGK